LIEWNQYSQNKFRNIKGEENMAHQLYTKANVKPETNTILKLISAKEHRPVYEIVEELLRNRYAEYYNFL
jgi:hypothetical protein